MPGSTTVLLGLSAVPSEEVVQTLGDRSESGYFAPGEVENFTRGSRPSALRTTNRTSSWSLMPSPLGVSVGEEMKKSSMSWLLLVSSGSMTILARRAAGSTDCHRPGCALEA